MQGQSEAESPSLLRQRLAEQGMTVQNVKPAKQKPAKAATAARPRSPARRRSAKR
jgi:type II secretory pathway component PulF